MLLIEVDMNLLRTFWNTLIYLEIKTVLY